MFIKNNKSLTNDQTTELIMDNLKGYLDPTLPQVTNLANMSAILFAFLKQVNWAGFYLYDGTKLILGPFQGLPACVEIPFGKGVCGTAAKSRTSLIVPNTHEFIGHIACDNRSLSEIVIPIIKNNALFGVLDVDSPILNRFDNEDLILLEKAVNLLVDIL